MEERYLEYNENLASYGLSVLEKIEDNRSFYNFRNDKTGKTITDKWFLTYTPISSFKVEGNVFLGSLITWEEEGVQGWIIGILSPKGSITVLRKDVICG